MCVLRLLLGGSPCQWWSVARTTGRETEPTGIGWELFRNYVIARQKYQPDYFLYENNKSMAVAIREKITEELGVPPLALNSALVSAQNRQRLYWTNIPGVKPPQDRGIFLKDILESGVTWQDKSYCLTATQYKGVELAHNLTHHVRTLIAEKADSEQWERQVNLTGGDRHEEQSLQCIGQTNRHGSETRTHGTCAKTVYRVCGGQVEIRGRMYPIRLADGFYTVRNLTVRECMRLQTVPETYRFPVSRSQAIRLLGNAWTVRIITHILSHCPGIQTEPIEVLSMYDGMSCGRLALNQLGANVVRYCATEIDPYAIKTTLENFPDETELGDAFQVRDDNWILSSLIGR